MSMVFKRLSVITVLLLMAGVLLIMGCGSKQSPTGGKADTDKLKLLASLPEEFGEINDQTLELTFSKSVDRASFLQGMYIYPAIDKKKVYYESNVITIKILQALEQDTNYYLTLTTRIKDVRGNTLDKNQTLIYKHGNLQENRISGVLLYENAVDNGLPVQLNLLSADSVWVLTRIVTGKSYALQTLNPMDYILRAYIDKNLNGRFDLEQEPFSETIVPNQPVNTINLTMAYSDTLHPVIKTIQAKSNREYVITLNKPVKSFQKIRASVAATGQKIRIFAINHDEDKINLLTAQTDSSEIKFSITGLKDAKDNSTELSSQTVKGSTEEDKTPPLVIRTIPRNGSSVSSLQPRLEITFNEVIPDTTFRASITEAETKKDIPFRIISSNSSKYILQPEKPLTNYKSYVLTIDDNTSDISGNKLQEPFKLAFLPLIRETSTEQNKQ